VVPISGSCLKLVLIIYLCKWQRAVALKKVGVRMYIPGLAGMHSHVVFLTECLKLFSWLHCDIWSGEGVIQWLEEIKTYSKR
jgi:hypothetical protein